LLHIFENREKSTYTSFTVMPVYNAFPFSKGERCHNFNDLSKTEGLGIDTDPDLVK
jgi:hypothetical protein